LKQEVRVRFAPSPTGYLHVGGARTALFNYLFQKKHDGKFILRIEDTDLVRSSSEMVEQILESMRWLGLEWDEGPFYQSERFSLYDAAVKKLLEEGKAYYCFCDPELLKNLRQDARKKGGSYRYDRRCLALPKADVDRMLAEGRPHAVRFKVPEGVTSARDVVHGEISFENSQIEDFVLRKADGSPTYHLAVVTDDRDMRVTHVIRGDDHYNNIPKQVLLYKALGYEPPEFAHVPLILGPNKAKLSKRNADVAVSDYERAGFMPEAVRNFLALLGWSPGDNRELMSLSELIDAFSLEGISKANAVFDVKKLEWMNSEYVRMLSSEELYERTKAHFLESGLIDDRTYAEASGYVKEVLLLLQERVRKLSEYPDVARYFFTADFEYDPKGVKKHFSDATALKILAALADRFEYLDEFSLENIEATVRGLAEDLDFKAGKVIHTTRLACSGRTVGPSLFHLVEVLGRERVLARLRRAIDYVKGVVQ